MNSQRIIGITIVGFLVSSTIDIQRTYANTNPKSIASTIASDPSEDPRSDRSPWQLIKAKTSKGMSYNEFRQFALSNGWEPLPDGNCKRNVGGTAEICKTRPETSACSGDGYCIFNFQHWVKDVTIKISTYGDRIRWTEYTRKQKVEMASASCPSQNFTEFLTAFSKNKSIRTQFMMPKIRVVELIDDENGFRDRVIFVPKDQYQGFDLAYQNNSFYYTDSNGKLYSKLTVSYESERARNRLNIVKQGNDYFVSTRINMSEGNSWLFKRSGDCWALAEDPEAPSP